MGDWHPRQGPGGGGLIDWGQAATAHFHGSGTPVGHVTPGGIGDLYVDDTTPALWQATGLLNTDWQQVGGGGSQPGALKWDGPHVVTFTELNAFVGSATPIILRDAVDAEILIDFLSIQTAAQAFDDSGATAAFQGVVGDLIGNVAQFGSAEGVSINGGSSVTPSPPAPPEGPLSGFQTPAHTHPVAAIAGAAQKVQLQATNAVGDSTTGQVAIYLLSSVPL